MNGRRRPGEEEEEEENNVFRNFISVLINHSGIVYLPSELTITDKDPNTLINEIKTASAYFRLLL